jgi:hypothetical protein
MRDFSHAETIARTRNEPMNQEHTPLIVIILASLIGLAMTAIGWIFFIWLVVKTIQFVL